MQSVVLLLGSNLNNRNELLRCARHHLVEMVGDMIGSTSEIETEAVGYDSGNLYLNQIVVLSTNYSPIEVLDRTQSIERMLGRVQRTSREQPYSDRTIDIDLLYYYNNNQCSGTGITYNSKRLILPHPEIQNRSFVLELLDML